MITDCKYCVRCDNLCDNQPLLIKKKKYLYKSYMTIYKFNNKAMPNCFESEILKNKPKELHFCDCGCAEEYFNFYSTIKPFYKKIH